MVSCVFVQYLFCFIKALYQDTKVKNSCLAVSYAMSCRTNKTANKTAQDTQIMCPMSWYIY